MNQLTKGMKNGLIRWDENLPDGNEREEQKKIIERFFNLLYVLRE